MTPFSYFSFSSKHLFSFAFCNTFYFTCLSVSKYLPLNSMKLKTVKFSMLVIKSSIVLLVHVNCCLSLVFREYIKKSSHLVLYEWKTSCLSGIQSSCKRDPASPWWVFSYKQTWKFNRNDHNNNNNNNNNNDMIKTHS